MLKLDYFHHVLWLAVDVFNQKMCSDDLPEKDFYSTEFSVKGLGGVR